MFDRKRLFSWLLVTVFSVSPIFSLTKTLATPTVAQAQPSGPDGPWPRRYGGFYRAYFWYPPTHGFAAWYNPYTGTLGRGAAVYGPYGGAGGWAAYNPRTGTYARGGAVYGPYGSRGKVAPVFIPVAQVEVAPLPDRGVVYAGHHGNVYRKQDGPPKVIANR